MISAGKYVQEFVSRFIPYLNWIGELKNPNVVWKDCIAGLTVALVLIPQSMAYAQLAGLPAYYGLYASFLPVIVASLFGSSRQLQTGPVAVVSLMTATALAPLASANPEGYLAYAAVLAIGVGIFQMSLGLLRLGVLVPFLYNDLECNCRSIKKYALPNTCNGSICANPHIWFKTLCTQNSRCAHCSSDNKHCVLFNRI